MEKSRQILSIGALIVDMVCEVDRLPGSGQGEVARGYRMALGGSEANAANMARQMGVGCELLAPVGKGVFADFTREQLRRNGFTPFEVATDLDNGACVAFVEPDGERTMITLPGIERAFDPAWFDRIAPESFCAALTSGYELDGAAGEPILGFLEANPQILFYYAPGPRVLGVGSGKVARINALRPVWHLNDMEALAYTGLDDLAAAGEEILAQCRNAVVITAGADGAHLFTEEGHLLVPSVPVQAVDTIGAGDAHLGALVAARSRGASWQEALGLANRLAAAVCLQKGALLPDATVEALLADTQDDGAGV